MTIEYTGHPRRGFRHVIAQMDLHIEPGSFPDVEIEAYGEDHAEARLALLARLLIAQTMLAAEIETLRATPAPATTFDEDQ